MKINTDLGKKPKVISVEVNKMSEGYLDTASSHVKSLIFLSGSSQQSQQALKEFQFLSGKWDQKLSLFKEKKPCK